MWHKDLIPHLPDMHILAQWRELCAIIKDIAETGATHHVLINPVMEYPWEHFYCYGEMVARNLRKRGYDIKKSYATYKENLEKAKQYFPVMESVRKWSPYPEWHNEKYLIQCYYNLEEKHDRGMITDNDWEHIRYCRPIIGADIPDVIPF
jgi:uncharacterized protein (TIGR02328 family)